MEQRAQPAGPAAPDEPSGRPLDRRVTTLLLLGVVWIASFVPFAGALDATFVAFDDGMHIVENPIIHQGWSWETLRFALTTMHSANWHPLTWASYITDIELYGLNAGGHHLTSLLLHATNGALLALLLFRLTSSAWWSGAGALLFSLHPLRVESVAWVSERKDVLSGLFLLLALLAWLDYGRTRNARAYLLALLAAALGLMSKPMLVTLPVLLLLVDVWPLGRLPWPGAAGLAAFGKTAGRLVIEKLPFFGLSLASSLVTLYAQWEGGAVSTFAGLPLVPRLENALVSLGRYAWKTLWPTDLIVFYSYPTNGWPLATVLGVAVWTLAVCTVAAVLLRRGRPAFATAWSWILVSLLPVIGIIQVGGQSIADRYTYVPHVWPVVVLATFLAGLARAQRPLRLVSVFVIVALALTTMKQVDVWHDSRSLFTHVVEVEPENGRGWGRLAWVEMMDGRWTEGEAAAKKSVDFQPDIAEHHFLLARALARRGEHRAAIESYVEALTLDATEPEGHALLALSLFAIGDVTNAKGEALKARESGTLSPARLAQLEQAWRDADRKAAAGASSPR